MCGWPASGIRQVGVQCMDLVVSAWPCLLCPLLPAAALLQRGASLLCRFPITNITIANLDLPFLDEFGGRWVVVLHSGGLHPCMRIAAGHA